MRPRAVFTTSSVRGMTRLGELFELGREAVVTRAHECDKPPLDGGRWGIAVILKPDAMLTQQLAEITSDAMRVAGSHHWPTGSPKAVHFTVRALEPFRTDVPGDDPSVGRYTAALERAAKRKGLVTRVEERRETLVGHATLDTAQLIRYVFNGHHTELDALASVVLQPLLQGVAHQLGPVVQL